PKGNGPTDCPVPSCEGRRRGSDKLLPYQISTAVEGENPPPVVSGRLIHHPRTLHNTARLLADERAEVARQGHGGGGQAELRDRNADVSSLGGLLVLLPSMDIGARRVDLPGAGGNVVALHDRDISTRALRARLCLPMPTSLEDHHASQCGVQRDSRTEM